MAARLAWLALAAAVAGCTDGDDGPVAFTGALAGAEEIGRLELSVAAGRDRLADDGSYPTGPDDPLAASGRLILPGGTSLSLSGNYDRSSGTLYVSGGGYVLGAYLEHDLDPGGLVLEGQYLGPKGHGRLTLLEGRPAEVRVLCGEFAGSAEGRWAVVLGGGLTTALAVPYAEGSPSTFMVGELSGDEASYWEETEYGAPAPARATGIVAPDRGSAQGSWNEGDGAGDWSARAADCDAP